MHKAIFIIVFFYLMWFITLLSLLNFKRTIKNLSNYKHCEGVCLSTSTKKMKDSTEYRCTIQYNLTGEDVIKEVDNTYLQLEEGKQYVFYFDNNSIRIHPDGKITKELCSTPFTEESVRKNTVAMRIANIAIGIVCLVFTGLYVYFNIVK